MNAQRLPDPAAAANAAIDMVLADMASTDRRGIVVDSPPGAGKTTLVIAAAVSLIEAGEPCMMSPKPTTRSTTWCCG